MSNDRVVSHIALFACLGSGGFIKTKLRAHSEESLDAIYRVIETSALGTLSRKHFYFVLENSDGVYSAAVPAYIPHYKGVGVAGREYPLAATAYKKRRYFRNLQSALTLPASYRQLQALLDREFDLLMATSAGFATSSESERRSRASVSQRA